MITYPVDTANTKWALFRVSTQAVVSRNKPWPTADGSEVPGLDPDYVWLLDEQYIPEGAPGAVAVPDYDGRMFQLEITNTVDVANNILFVAYNVIDRVVEERLVAIENREVEELEKMVDFQKELIETRLALSAVIDAIDGTTLPTKVRQILNAYKAKGVKIWKNRDTADQKRAAVIAGQAPDPDSGWQQ